MRELFGFMLSDGVVHSPVQDGAQPTSVCCIPLFPRLMVVIFPPSILSGV